MAKTTQSTRLLAPIAFLLALSSPVGVSGEIIRYDSLEEWQAAVPNHATHSFPRPMPAFDFPTSGGTFDAGWVNVVIPANHGDIRIAGYFQGDVHRSGQGDPQYNRFEFKTSVRAVAFSLLGMDGIHEPLEVAVLDQSFLVYTQLVPRPFGPGRWEGFFGITSTMPFDSLEIRHPGVINNNEFYIIGQMRLQNVPEAAASSLLVGAVLVSGLVRRRRARQGTDSVP